MLKIRFLISIIILISVLAAGCSSGTATSKGSTAAAVAEGEKVAIPEEAPALVGRVKDIVGNEVTVYTVQIPVDRVPGEQRQSPANQEASPPEQGQRPENGFAGPTATGETETFIIPVGTPIVTMQRGTGETTPVELTDIKKDQLIQVWKNDDTVMLVNVMVTGGRQRPEGAAGADRPAGWPDGPPSAGMGGMGGGRQP